MSSTLTVGGRSIMLICTRLMQFVLADESETKVDADSSTTLIMLILTH